MNAITCYPEPGGNRARPDVGRSFYHGPFSADTSADGALRLASARAQALDSHPVTEVPEYLLERSRARRAALGLAPSGGAPAAAPAGGGDGGDAAGAAVPALAAEAAPAAAPAAAIVVEPPAPPKPAIDPGPRSGVPFWMMPVIVILPLWAIMYLGAFGEKAVDEAALTPVQRGRVVYQQKAGCGSCHGATGGGGVGPKLSDGEVALTFLTPEEHIAFVKAGSKPIQGQPYGNPDRPGGQHVAKSGGMPGFGGQLTDEEIADVVAYERSL